MRKRRKRMSKEMRETITKREYRKYRIGPRLSKREQKKLREMKFQEGIFKKLEQIRIDVAIYSPYVSKLPQDKKDELKELAIKTIDNLNRLILELENMDLRKYDFEESGD